MLKQSAIYIGSWIWNQLEEEKKEELKNKNINEIHIQNNLKIILLYISVTLTLLLFGWITNLWLELLISFLSFAFIRWWNGGHHFSVNWCYLVTIGVLLGTIGLASFEEVVLGAWMVALVMQVMFAPYRSRNLLKKTISVIVCAASYFISDITVMMWFVLSFDLINWRNRK